ncbi:MAG: glycosyltransferase [Anaerolineales bacterium]
MIDVARQSGYVLDRVNNIWKKTSYKGIAYNDGDETEQRIAGIIYQASDISIFSTELRKHCTDWTTLYHLSSNRANILRPFENGLVGDILEVGAGCGAITRYLGERGANILALEGSPRRAAITRSRTRDLENVTVLADSFDQFTCDRKFDVITLIGVLEYANLFMSDDNPPLAMLAQANALLKPEGRLIVAIENQLGLKYFAGAPEDHHGEAMVGIEGRYRKDQPQTFGRKVLSDMLEQAGFSGSEYLVPFPDYKLPVSILTEEGINNKKFDAAAFAWQSARRDPQLPPYSNFSIELVWPEVFRNAMALDVANSFLIIASPNLRQLIDRRVLAYHYTTERVAAYCKEAVFTLKDDGDIFVRYKRLGRTKGDGGRNYTKKPLVRYICSDQDEYVLGKPLSIEFIHTVTKDGWSFDQVARFVWHYLKIVETFVRSAGMQFGCDSPYDEVSGDFLDAIPQNIILRKDGTAVLIDKEWVIDGPIEVGYLIFRALHLLLNSITRFGSPASGGDMTRDQFIYGSFAAVGLELEKEDYDRYVTFEAGIQQTVTGRPAEEFLNWVKDTPLPMLNLSLALAEREGQIAGLNQTVAERDGLIANLNQAAAERDGLIANLNQAAAERDGLIANLNQAAAELDSLIASLNGKIATLEQALSVRDGQITHIYQSKSWRVTRPLRAVRQLADSFMGLILWHLMRNTYTAIRGEVHRHGAAGFARRLTYYLRHYRTYVELLAFRAPAFDDGLFNATAPAPVDIKLHPDLLDVDESIDASISIVIPTLNAGPEFQWLLRKLRAQRGLNKLEIVIVDSGSRDGTTEIARAAGCNVIEIPPSDFTHSYARNAGADAAQSDYLLFMVQDAYPIGNYWAYGILRYLLDHSDEKLIAVSCSEYSRSDSDMMYDSMINTHYRFLGCLDYDRIGEQL